MTPVASTVASASSGASLVGQPDEGDLVAQRLVHRLERRHLLDARRAPRGEEVHDDGLSPVSRSPRAASGRPVEGLQPHLGGRARQLARGRELVPVAARRALVARRCVIAAAAASSSAKTPTAATRANAVATITARRGRRRVATARRYRRPAATPAIVGRPDPTRRPEGVGAPPARAPGWRAAAMPPGPPWGAPPPCGAPHRACRLADHREPGRSPHSPQCRRPVVGSPVGAASGASDPSVSSSTSRSRDADDRHALEVLGDGDVGQAGPRAGGASVAVPAASWWRGSSR